MAPQQTKKPISFELDSRPSAPERLASADSERDFETKFPSQLEQPESEKQSFTTKYFEKMRPGETSDQKSEPTLRTEPLASSFGRYQLKGILGKGGMGEVYLAHDTVLHRNIALKAPRLADNSPVQRERFLREARAAAALDHPNICPIHDVDDHEGQLYLTMAYVEGDSLSAYLRKNGPLDPDHAVRLIHKVALAMHHAHERGLLHRDLKPGNILLTKTGEPVVTDFGLAFRFDAIATDRITQSGVVVGTPSYMPPEQINGQELGPAADVYALSVVLYELLTGKPPFEGPLGKLIAQIESAAPQPPRQRRSGLDPKLEAICLKALAKQPAERHRDMAAFAGALHEYADEKHQRQLAEQATAALRQKMRRRFATLAGTMLLVIAGTISAAVVWARRDRNVAPVPEMQLSDADRLFEALVKPLLKFEVVLSADAPVRVDRQFLPPSLLLVPTSGGQTRMHLDPLYFSLSGNGTGHALDLSDQPGQAAQITHFSGDITVTAPYLLFLGTLTSQSRIYIKGGIGYSILAPMNGGLGCKHVEFDGTHFLPPKLGNPEIDVTKATGAELATLRNPDLTEKVVWKYDDTEYIIYCRPGTQVVPGNHEQRKAAFPRVYEIVEADRLRQGPALSISNARLQQALREVGR